MKRAWLSWALLSGAAGAAVAGSGCGSSSSPPAVKPTGTRADLIDSTTCKTCHAEHYDDWSKSMHAYASDDPVFLAMNARGQRETGGKLGKFCVQCHAPMALKDGQTDGANLDKVDQPHKGVTCYFCHSIDAVEADAGYDNAAVHLADDLVMRGELQSPPPVANTMHASTYSPLHDDMQHQTAEMCGACHDIVTPLGGHIERTFAEWNASYFNQSGTTCAAAGCHMNPSPGIQVATNGPLRTFHEHDFPAVDIALTPGFPPTASQVANVETALQPTLQGGLCVNSVGGGIRVFLDDVAVGHYWPSGAAQDRRAWAEVVAYKNGAPIYQSGVVPPGTAVGSEDADTNLNDLWVLRDQMFGVDGGPVDMFWQASCAGGNELQSITFMAENLHVFRHYPNTPNPGDSTLLPMFPMPDRVTLRIRLQPIGIDVLNNLVASGDLDAGIIAQMPTLEVPLPNLGVDGGMSLYLEWTPEAAKAEGNLADPTHAEGPMTCVSTNIFNFLAGAAMNPPTACSNGGQ
jgi:hypothetical protein